MSDQNKLQSFYYTFGTSDSFPYKKGWVEVQAPDREQADQLFSKHFPDRTLGILNCSSVYNQAAFEEMQRRGIPKDWNICHEVISSEELTKRQAPEQPSGFWAQVAPNFWAQINNSYFENVMIDEKNGDMRAFISIDAWKTQDDNEPGESIATVILTEHGDIVVDYRDGIARTDPAAQECIQDAIQQLKEYALENGITQLSQEAPKQGRTPEEIYESLRADGEKGMSAAALVGVTMYHLAYSMKDPMPIQDLRALAEKVNMIQSNSNHAYATEEAVAVVRSLCRMGLDFSKLSSQDPFYGLLSERVQQPFSPEATRQALINMPDDAFAELIADFAERNRNDIFSGHHRIDVSMSDMASEWIKALRTASDAKKVPLSEQVRSAQDRAADQQKEGQKPPKER